MSVIIENVICQKQGKRTIYVFTLTAYQLKKLGIISRLHENHGGVQRRLDQDKAAEIALAMRDPKNSWLDTILVHMEPDDSWFYKDGSIIGDDRFRLSIDDGQHRHYALEVLNDEELEAIGEFTITAAAGLTRDERLQLFLQQEKRRHIHRNTLLRGKKLIGGWSTETERVAYELVLALEKDIRSPLRGRIELDEVVKIGNLRDRNVPIEKPQPKLLASGLHSTLKTVIGNKSILYNMNPDNQKDILIRFLSIAATKVWKKEWENWEENILSASRGVTALLRLFTNSKVLRMVLIDNDFADQRLNKVLLLGTQFDWSTTTNRLRTDKELVEKLDERMSRAFSANTKARDRRYRERTK